MRTIFLLLLTLVTTFGQARVPTIGTNGVVVTNDGPHFVTAEGGSAPVSVHKRAGTDLTLYDFDSTLAGGSDITLVVSNLPSATRVRVPKVDPPFWISSLTNANKQLWLHFDNGAQIRHMTNAVGDMFHLEGGSIKLTGNGILDGNKAHQASTSTNWFSILYPKDPDIDGITFTNFFRAAITDFQTTTEARIVNSRFMNGYQLATNATLANCAVFFAPAPPNTNPRLTIENIYLENEAATGRLPGGVFIAGSDPNNSYIGASIRGMKGNRVGDDHVVGAAHYGIAFLDSYEDLLYLHGEDFYLTNSRYIGLKIQNAQDVSISKFVLHTTGTEGINYTPGERLQTNEYWGAVFSEGKIYGDPLRTLGAGIHAGFSGGFHNVTLDNIAVTNCMRGYQVEGFTDIGTLEGYGPVTLRNLYAYVTNHNALEVFGYSGRLGIYGGELVSTGANAVRITQTNSTADIEIIGTKLRAEGAGWALRVHGVKSLTGFGNQLSSTGGEAVELAENTEGDNIQKVIWGDDNIISSGTVDITNAQIDSGYFTQNGTRTFFPAGLSEVMSGAGGSTYFRELRLDDPSAVLLHRLRNENAAGAVVSAFRVGPDVIASFSAFGTNYSDAGRAGRMAWRAENASGTRGLKMEAPFSGQSLEFLAGDTTSRFQIDVAGAKFPTLTASRALVLDANKNVTYSSADTNDLNNISTLTSDAQTQINNRQPLDGDLTVIANNNPGNSYYYGTDGAGTKGFYTFPGAATHTNTVTVVCSDLTTAITSGAGKGYWRAPFACTVVDVRAHLVTASSSGAVTVDINEAGATILTTKLTIDQSELTSTTAATPYVIGGAGPALSDDAEITVDIDGAGTNAAGLYITIYYTRS